jgi:hypothetical protein
VTPSDQRRYDREAGRSIAKKRGALAIQVRTGALITSSRAPLLDARRETGVDGQRHTGDISAFVGDQPEDRVADVDRLHRLHR